MSVSTRVKGQTLGLSGVADLSIGLAFCRVTDLSGVVFLFLAFPGTLASQKKTNRQKWQSLHIRH